MKVLVTGQVGLRKGEYLQKLKEIANSKNIATEVSSIGPTIINKHQGKIDETTILNLPKTQLDLLRRSAWDDILNKAKGVKDKDIFIVNSHAVFRWHHGLFPAIDLDLLLKFSPDKVFTLIDDIDKIKKELEDRKTPFFKLWELIAWREEEIWITKLLVDSLNKLIKNGKSQFFLLPKAQEPKLMFRLLTKPDIPKVYLSFPITGLPDDRVIEVKKFKKKVMENFIGFDPIKLKEREILTIARALSSEINETLEPIKEKINKLKTDDSFRWNLLWDKDSFLELSEIEVRNIKLEGRDVRSVLEAIDSQIISRDYLLIDQSDFVWMYIPMVILKEDDKEQLRPYISAGSQSEMIYAYSNGKPVYVTCEGGKEQLSPWITQYSEVFKNLDLTFEFILDKYFRNKEEHND